MERPLRYRLIPSMEPRTGISAFERSLKVIQRLIDPDRKAQDFRRPGHIFPLIAHEGGVLRRAGHTEAGVDLGEVYAELIRPESSVK